LSSDVRVERDGCACTAVTELVVGRLRIMTRAASALRDKRACIIAAAMRRRRIRHWAYGNRPFLRAKVWACRVDASVGTMTLASAIGVETRMPRDSAIAVRGECADHGEHGSACFGEPRVWRVVRLTWFGFGWIDGCPARSSAWSCASACRRSLLRKRRAEDGAVRDRECGVRFRPDAVHDADRESGRRPLQSYSEVALKGRKADSRMLASVESDG